MFSTLFLKTLSIPIVLLPKQRTSGGWGCREKRWVQKKKDAKFLNRVHLFLKRGLGTQYSQQMIVIASMVLCSILEHMAEFPVC